MQKGGFVRTQRTPLDPPLIAAPQLNARLHEQWLTFSWDHITVPDIKILIDFLKEKMATTTPTSTSQAKPLCHDSKQAKATYCQANTTDRTCKICRGDQHLLYSCPTFKTLPHNRKLSVVNTNKSCQSCLAPGHSSKVCRSFHRCKKSSKSHHTMLHVDGQPMVRPNATITDQASPQLNNGTTDDTASSSSAEPLQANVNITSALVQSSASSQLKLEDIKLPPTLQMTSQVYVESHIANDSRPAPFSIQELRYLSLLSVWLNNCTCKNIISL